MAPKKRMHFTVGGVVFAAILLYTLATAFLLVTRKQVISYIVTSGTLSNNDAFDAIAIRQEKLIHSGMDGFVSYYMPENARASKGDTVCSVGTQAQQQMATQPDLAKIRQAAAEFSAGYDENNFQSVYDFQSALQAAATQQQDQAVVQGAAVQTDSDGVVSFTTDGGEGLTVEGLTADDFQRNAFANTQLRQDQAIQAGAPLFRLITSDTWQLVFPISARQNAALAEKKFVSVRFQQDGRTERGDLKLFEKDKQHYAQVTLYSGMVRYDSDRFVPIELVTNTQSGLKLPVSAIVKKDFYLVPVSFMTSGPEQQEGFTRRDAAKGSETGSSFVAANVYARGQGASDKEMYYVDPGNISEGDVLVKPGTGETYTVGKKAALSGVYCLNRGYAEFRQIDIIDQNEEFCIVKSGTDYGIVQYDHIVRDGSAVSESEILR